MDKINIEEVLKECNEIITLAENYRTAGDKLFKISTNCTKEVLSFDGIKPQEMIDEVGLNLKNTYLEILSKTNEVKLEAIRINEIQNKITQ